MKKYGFTLMFLCGTYFLHSQVRTFTLQEAIDFALENHDEIRAAMLEVSDAAANVREYTATGLPKLSGNVQYQHFIDIPTSIIPRGSFFAGDPGMNIPPNPAEDLAVRFGVKNNLTAGISTDILIFDGSFFVGLQAARLFKDMVNQQTGITKENIAYNVAKAYVGVLVAKRNAELLQKNIGNLEKTINETHEILQQGFIEKLDLDRLIYSLNNLRVEEQKTNSLIELSENLLKFSMGLGITEKIQTSGTLEDIGLTGYEELAVDELEAQISLRPAYVALQTADQLNELNIKRLKFQYLPVLRGFGSYSRILQGNNLGDGRWFPATLVGLSLQVPIFDGLEKSSRIDRAKIARDKHLVDIDMLEKSIQLEVENAKLSCKNAWRTIQSARTNEELALSIYNTSLIKYREGVGSSLEISQAERDLYFAQGNYINALYELSNASIDLDKALGRIMN